MKITIVACEAWETKDRQNGTPIQGLSYIGYIPNGNAIKFTSREDYVVHTGHVGYDEALAQEVNILTRFFNGKISYQDGASFGRDGQGDR